MGKEPSEAKGVTALQGHHAQMRRQEAVEREGGGQRWPGREARRARLFRKQRFGLEHQEPGAAEQECEQERRAARAGAGLSAGLSWGPADVGSLSCNGGVRLSPVTELLGDS